MKTRSMWPLMAWFYFCALAATADARIVESFKLGGWRGDAFVNDQSGRFASCVAIARYRNNISMSVQVDANYNWWIAFSSPGWSLKPGEKIALRYRIDEDGWQQGTATAMSTKLARIPMPAGGYFISRFRRGRSLSIDDQVNTFRFTLTNTARLLSSLAKCVQKNAGIYGTAPLANARSNNSRPTAQGTMSPSSKMPRKPEFIIEASQALFNLMGHLGVRGVNLRNKSSRRPSLKGIHAVATNDTRTLVAHIFERGKYRSEKAVLTSVISQAAKNCPGDFSSNTGSQRRGGAELHYGHSTCRADKFMVSELYAITRRKRGGIYTYGLSDKQVRGGGGGSDENASVSPPQSVFVSAEQFRIAASQSSP
ncbi:MAG: hypothetical protein ABJH63_02580 [Rhizobiaceae bacterium]